MPRKTITHRERRETEAKVKRVLELLGPNAGKLGGLARQSGRGDIKQINSRILVLERFGDSELRYPGETVDEIIGKLEHQRAASLELLELAELLLELTGADFSA